MLKNKPIQYNIFHWLVLMIISAKLKIGSNRVKINSIIQTIDIESSKILMGKLLVNMIVIERKKIKMLNPKYILSFGIILFSSFN